MIANEKRNVVRKVGNLMIVKERRKRMYSEKW